MLYLTGAAAARPLVTFLESWSSGQRFLSHLRPASTVGMARVPDAQELQGLREWCTGMDPDSVNVVMAAVALFQSNPPLTAARVDGLARRSSTQQFTQLLAAVGLPDDFARWDAESHFAGVIKRHRQGAQPALAPSPTAIIANVVVDAVQNAAGQPEAEVRRLAEQAYTAAQNLHGPAQEQTEAVGAYISALFKHGPGSSKLGAVLRPGAGSVGGVLMEEGTGGALMVVGDKGSHWKEWLVSPEALRRGFQRAWERAGTDRQFGAKERLIKVNTYLEGIGWPMRKKLFEVIMGGVSDPQTGATFPYCTLPFVSYHHIHTALLQEQMDTLMAKNKPGTMHSPCLLSSLPVAQGSGALVSYGEGLHGGTGALSDQYGEVAEPYDEVAGEVAEPYGGTGALAEPHAKPHSGSGEGECGGGFLYRTKPLHAEISDSKSGGDFLYRTKPLHAKNSDSGCGGVSSPLMQQRVEGGIELVSKKLAELDQTVQEMILPALSDINRFVVRMGGPAGQLNKLTVESKGVVDTLRSLHQSWLECSPAPAPDSRASRKPAQRPPQAPSVALEAQLTQGSLAVAMDALPLSHLGVPDS